MARDLTLKLRLALEDQGVAGKLSRAAASIVGLRREVVALGADSRRSLQALRDGMDSISRQLSGIERMARAAFLVFPRAALRSTSSKCAKCSSPWPRQLRCSDCRRISSPARCSPCSR